MFGFSIPNVEPVAQNRQPSWETKSLQWQQPLQDNWDCAQAVLQQVISDMFQYAYCGYFL
jgi:cyclopropane fatty-acyl-phospholipid synthase-like methyltransferase